MMIFILVKPAKSHKKIDYIKAYFEVKYSFIIFLIVN